MHGRLIKRLVDAAHQGHAEVSHQFDQFLGQGNVVAAGSQAFVQITGGKLDGQQGVGFKGFFTAQAVFDGEADITDAGFIMGGAAGHQWLIADRDDRQIELYLQIRGKTPGSRDIVDLDLIADEIINTDACPGRSRLDRLACGAIFSGCRRCCGEFGLVLDGGEDR